MIGVMTKDLYQNFWQKKERFNQLLYLFVSLATMLLIKNTYGILFPALIMIPFVIVPTLLQVSTYQDEKSNYEKILLTMPVTKKEIILAKYCLGLLYSLSNTLLVLIGILIHIYIYHSIDWSQGLYIIFTNIILSLLSLAINYLSYIVLGNIGVLVNIALIIPVFIAYFWNPAFFNLEIIGKMLLSLHPMALTGLGFLFALLCVGISYLCSAWYYSEKAFH